MNFERLCLGTIFTLSFIRFYLTVLLQTFLEYQLYLRLL